MNLSSLLILRAEALLNFVGQIRSNWFQSIKLLGWINLRWNFNLNLFSGLVSRFYYSQHFEWLRLNLPFTFTLKPDNKGTGFRSFLELVWWSARSRARKSGDVNNSKLLSAVRRKGAVLLRRVRFNYTGHHFIYSGTPETDWIYKGFWGRWLRWEGQLTSITWASRSFEGQV